MKIVFCTDLHGNTSYYDQLADVARMAEADVVINGGDMLPKDGGLFRQDDFITGFLTQHLSTMNDAGIRYLCYLGNDDLALFDNPFQKMCDQYPLVTNLAQCHVEIAGYDFVRARTVIVLCC